MIGWLMMGKLLCSALMAQILPLLPPLHCLVPPPLSTYPLTKLASPSSLPRLPPLQTSAEIVAVLGLTQGSWIVDSTFCEVRTHRLAHQ